MHTANKRLYIEIIRIIACFCVIFTHTAEDGYFLFSLFPENSIKYWLYMMLSVFVKSAVPMFFTISGALLLGKEESLGDLYKKRIFKIIIVLVVFSFTYYMRSVVTDLSEFSIKKFFEVLIISNWNFTYWYLYAYISFLIGLPFLRNFAQNMKKNEFVYLFICVIAYKVVIPIIEYIFWQGSQTINGYIRTIWFNVDIFFYPVLGYFLENRINIDKIKKWIIPLWTINFFTLLFTCLMTYYKVKVTGECNETTSQTFFSCFSWMNVLTVYISFKLWLKDRCFSPIIVKVICSLGEATFGIYLFHLMFLRKLPMIQRVWYIVDRIFGEGSMMAVFIVCGCVMVMSYVTTLIMKNIPFVKRLL